MFFSNAQNINSYLKNYDICNLYLAANANCDVSSNINSCFANNVAVFDTFGKLINRINGTLKINIVYYIFQIYTMSCQPKNYFF